MTLPDWLSHLLLWLSGALVPDKMPMPSPTPPDEAASSGAPAPTRDVTAPAEPAPVPAPAPAAPQPALPSEENRAVPDDVINDATAYGVSIVPVDVPVGTTYWRVVRVHHLTPDENHGNHHVYLDALDEAGQRLLGAQARFTWSGGEQVLTVDKPANEPGANFPMWKWQVVAVEMQGLPSDKVTNLHTGHPDEPPGMGNTLFHHSFHVDFKRTVKSTPPPPQHSVISGVVTNGAGRTLVLTRDGSPVASTVVDAAGAYRFANLAAGTYQLRVEDSSVQSDLITVDGENSVTVNLTVPVVTPPSRPMERYVLFGPPQSSRTAVYLSLAREYLSTQRPSFGFRPDDARQAQAVLIMGEYEDVSQEVEADLVASGCQVRRIRGTPEEVATALKALSGGGHSTFLPLTPVSP